MSVVVFALVDGNNFYCSCESAFQRELRGRPLVVWSNNDGCAIARSAEAKALGIRMGQPAHELRDYESRYGLQSRSANFALYGDLSRRILAIVRDYAPAVEPYSIDENFVSLQGVRDYGAFACELRDRIRRWVGIPNCVGVGRTKTLAKLANKLAKRGAGVVVLNGVADEDTALQGFPVENLWGVGARWSAKLRTLGIATAEDLRGASSDLILERFGVVLLRTQRELQGLPCIALEEVEPDRKQIVSTRSFGQRVEDPVAVAQALATFAMRATEKLRRRNLVAAGVWIFAGTDAFRPELPQHHPSRAMSLARPTGDSRIVLAAVREMLVKFLRRGYAYKRAGVGLVDLARPESVQTDLFEPAIAGDERLMDTMDAINRRFGRGTAGLGASGWKAKPAWGMRQQNVSPAFTTRWADAPAARC